MTVSAILLAVFAAALLLLVAAVADNLGPETCGAPYSAISFAGDVATYQRCSGALGVTGRVRRVNT